MTKGYPDECTGDVVAVARCRDVTIPEVATDGGVAAEIVCRWMRQADIDDGIKHGMSSAEQSELMRLRREWPAPCFRSGLIGSQSGVVQVQCSAYSVGVL